MSTLGASSAAAASAGRFLDAVAAWALEADIELLVVWPSEASFGRYKRHGFADRREPLVWLSEDPV